MLGDMKYLALFLTLALPLFSFQLTCPVDVPETRVLEKITYKEVSDGVRAEIRLSDGSVWKWTPLPYDENLLRKWMKGDEIFIKTLNHPGIALQNLKQPHYIPIVSISFDSYTMYPFIEEIGEECRSLILCDGSEWEPIFGFNVRTLHYWSLGDRVIPVRGLNGEYELINLDIPHENRGQIERTIQVYKKGAPSSD